jgi:hypothetical protein
MKRAGPLNNFCDVIFFVGAFGSAGCIVPHHLISSHLTSSHHPHAHEFFFPEFPPLPPCMRARSIPHPLSPASLSLLLSGGMNRLDRQYNRSIRHCRFFFSVVLLKKRSLFIFFRRPGTLPSIRVFSVYFGLTCAIVLCDVSICHRG